MVLSLDEGCHHTEQDAPNGGRIPTRLADSYLDSGFSRGR